MKRQLWKDAFSPMSDAAGDAVFAALAGLEEKKMTKRMKRRTMLVAALIAALLLTGATLAVTNSRQLTALIFPDTNVAGDADEAVQPLEESAATEAYTLSVDEYLCSESGLFIDLRLNTTDARERLVTFALEYDDQTIIEGSSYNNSLPNVYEDAGGFATIGGENAPLEISGMIAGGLKKLADAPYTVRLTAIMAEPACTVYDYNDVAEQVNSASKLPAISRYTGLEDGIVTYSCQDSFFVPDEDFVPDGFMLASYSGVWVESMCVTNRMSDIRKSRGLGWGEAFVAAVEELGFVRVVDTVSVEFTVDPAHACAVATPAETKFEFPELSVELYGGSFSAMESRMSILITPREPMDVNGGTEEIGEKFGGTVYYEFAGSEDPARWTSIERVGTDCAFYPSELGGPPVGSSVLYGQLNVRGTGSCPTQLELRAYVEPKSVQQNYDLIPHSDEWAALLIRHPEFDISVPLVPAKAESE